MKFCLTMVYSHFDGACGTFLLSFTGLDLVYFNGLFLGSEGLGAMIWVLSFFINFTSFWRSIKLVRWIFGYWTDYYVYCSISILAVELYRLPILAVSTVFVRLFGGGILDPFLLAIWVLFPGSSHSPIILWSFSRCALWSITGSARNLEDLDLLPSEPSLFELVKLVVLLL